MIARRGFSLVEAVVATGIVSVMLAAALNTLSAAARARAVMTDRVIAWNLARELLDDARALPFEEPNGTPSFGIEAGESITDATTFDDLDDYNGYQESPPRSAANAARSGLTAWKRSVAVTYANSTDPSLDSATPTKVKRIVVTVTKTGGLTFTLSALRTKGWEVRQ